MRRYSLTERGKFVVALLLIVLLLGVTVLIFVGEAFTQKEAPTDSLHNFASDEPAQEIAQAQAPQNSDNDESTPLAPALTNTVNADFDAGTMTFFFTPNAQTSLDENTVSVIGELLLSPKNTEDSTIVVEIPQLDDDDMAVLTTAVINAFSAHEVPLSDIVFIIYQPEPDTQTFKINISLR